MHYGTLSPVGKCTLKFIVFISNFVPIQHPNLTTMPIKIILHIYFLPTYKPDNISKFIINYIWDPDNTGAVIQVDTKCEHSLEFCKQSISQKKSKLILHFVRVSTPHSFQILFFS